MLCIEFSRCIGLVLRSSAEAYKFLNHLGMDYKNLHWPHSLRCDALTSDILNYDHQMKGGIMVKMPNLWGDVTEIKDVVAYLYSQVKEAGNFLIKQNTLFAHYRDRELVSLMDLYG